MANENQKDPNTVIKKLTIKDPYKDFSSFYKSNKEVIYKTIVKLFTSKFCKICQNR